MPWHRTSLRLRLNSKSCCRQRFYSLSTIYRTSRQSTDQPYQVCRDTLALLEAGRDNDDRPRPVEITAHVRSIRQQKKRAFVTLGDGSSSQSIQALVAPSDTTGLSTGAAVKIRGQWQKCPPSKEQSHELVAEEVEVLGHSDPETFPIRKHYLTPEYLRTLPHLRVRTPTNALIARTRSEAEYHLSTYFRNEGFIRLQPPVITSSDCEGAGEVFTVSPRKDVTDRSSTQLGATRNDEIANSEDEFFRGQKYLTVSNQLHLEAFVHEHQLVWALAPTFRAEHSDTPRHLSEFYMLEAEIRCETLDQVMDVVEGMIRHLVRKLRHTNISRELLEKGTKDLPDEAQPQVNTLSSRWEGLSRKYWPRITYTTAIQHLKQAAQEDSSLFEFNPDWESGLHLEHEKYIASSIGNGSPVFVTHYPQHIKPFYMLPTSQTLQSRTAKENGLIPETDSSLWKSHQLPPKLTREEELEQAHPTVACFDLLLPDLGELVGGSLREHRFNELAKRMSKDNLASLDWYLELRRFGSVPHGGFGLGYDRLLMYLSGAESVRDVVQWPRYYGRCDA